MSKIRLLADFTVTKAEAMTDLMIKLYCA